MDTHTLQTVIDERIDCGKKKSPAEDNTSPHPAQSCFVTGNRLFRIPEYQIRCFAVSIPDTRHTDITGSLHRDRITYHRKSYNMAVTPDVSLK